MIRSWPSSKGFSPAWCSTSSCSATPSTRSCSCCSSFKSRTCAWSTRSQLRRCYGVRDLHQGSAQLLYTNLLGRNKTNLIFFLARTCLLRFILKSSLALVTYLYRKSWPENASACGLGCSTCSGSSPPSTTCLSASVTSTNMRKSLA